MLGIRTVISPSLDCTERKANPSMLSSKIKFTQTQEDNVQQPRQRVTRAQDWTTDLVMFFCCWYLVRQIFLIKRNHLKCDNLFKHNGAALIKQSYLPACYSVHNTALLNNYKSCKFIQTPKFVFDSSSWLCENCTQKKITTVNDQISFKSHKLNELQLFYISDILSNIGMGIYRDYPIQHSQYPVAVLICTAIS